MPLVRATMGRSTNVAAEGDGTRDRRQPRIENRAEQSACSRTRKKPRVAEAQRSTTIDAAYIERILWHPSCQTKSSLHFL
jgi:hypothetical protein